MRYQVLCHRFTPSVVTTRLSSKFSGSVAAEEQFRISRSVRGFVGASVAYVEKRYEGFAAILGAPQPSIPDYTYGNLRIGMVTDGYTVTAHQ
jgi:iron complex outermembrane recepter protein